MAIALSAATNVRIGLAGTPYLPSPRLTLESEIRAGLEADASAASADASAGFAASADASADAAAASAASVAGVTGASFITASAEAGLSNERVLTDSASFTWDLSSPGQVKGAASAGDGSITPVKLASAAVTAVKLAASALGARSGMINGTLAQSRASNAETFAVKTLAGTDPSASDPVYFVFQDGAGGFVVRAITAALSVTASSGSTLGAANSAPFRIWCVAADDAGTVGLGIVKTVGGTAPSLSILSLDECAAYSSTAEGGAGAADSAQVIYSGTAFASRYLCLVGFGDWDSGLAAAGTWNAAPTRTITFGAGMARPGAPTGRRNHVMLPTVLTPAFSAVLADLGLSAAITPTSAANIIKAVPRVQCADGSGSAASLALIRGSTNIGGGTAASLRVSAFGGIIRTADAASVQTATAEIYDAPGAITSTTYKVQYVNQSGGAIVVNRTSGDADLVGLGRFSSSLTLEEIMA